VFSEKELADLTIAIGLMNALNRLGACPSNAKVELRTQDMVLRSHAVHRV
jgi:hypothetical protein